MSAAYLRIIGHTVEEAAKGAGVGERTLARWTVSPWWPDAEREAENRWLSGLVAHSRKAVIDAVKAGDADIGLKILERRVETLRPPTQRTENTNYELDPDDLTTDELREAIARINAGEDARHVHLDLLAKRGNPGAE